MLVAAQEGSDYADEASVQLEQNLGQRSLRSSYTRSVMRVVELFDPAYHLPLHTIHYHSACFQLGTHVLSLLVRFASCETGVTHLRHLSAFF